MYALSMLVQTACIFPMFYSLFFGLSFSSFISFLFAILLLFPSPHINLYQCLACACTAYFLTVISDT
jgi:hypothetical protein